MSQLLERILSRENMFTALAKVKANKGAGGVDGISTEEIDRYLRENWVEIRDKIRRRAYKPQPVRRVEIPQAKWRSAKTGNTYRGRSSH